MPAQSPAATRGPNDPYGFTAWAWRVIRALGSTLSGTHGLVLLLLAAHGNAEAHARPSARVLALRLGRSQNIARDALTRLEALGVIAVVGERTPRQAATWRLVLNWAPADPASATPADHLPTICRPSADPGSDEGEGEGEELPLSSYVAEGRRAPEPEREAPAKAQGEGRHVFDFMEEARQRSRGASLSAKWRTGRTGA